MRFYQLPTEPNDNGTNLNAPNYRYRNPLNRPMPTTSPNNQSGNQMYTTPEMNQGNTNNQNNMNRPMNGSPNNYMAKPSTQPTTPTQSAPMPTNNQPGMNRLPTGTPGGTQGTRQVAPGTRPGARPITQPATTPTSQPPTQAPTQPITQPSTQPTNTLPGMNRPINGRPINRYLPGQTNQTPTTNMPMTPNMNPPYVERPNYGQYPFENPFGSQPTNEGVENDGTLSPLYNPSYKLPNYTEDSTESMPPEEGSSALSPESLKAIQAAVQGEKNDSMFYEDLINLAPSPEDKDIIRSIRDDELKHNALYRDLYRKYTGNEIGPGVDLPYEDKPVDYRSGLQTALFGELGAVERYRKIRRDLTSEQDRDTLFDIITDELKHADKYNFLIHKSSEE